MKIGKYISQMTYIRITVNFIKSSLTYVKGNVKEPQRRISNQTFLVYVSHYVQLYYNGMSSSAIYLSSQ